ncbi:neutral/alkaline non-lysosomal ceramidase N-terminal domain-containing protein [Candidatus Poribacteria bacterium]
MELCVGSAKVNITPPLSIPYLGYVPRQARFSGIHDPLFARAMVLGNGNEKLAIISADSLGFGNQILGVGRDFTAEVRQKINDRIGIEPHNIMIACTHAHAAPETMGITRLSDVPQIAPWLEVLMDQLASAVEMAASNLAPARLKLGIGQVKSISHNRRAKGISVEDQIAQGLLDTQVGVLLCEGLENNESSIIVNFACHPVTVQVQPLVSAGYPGVTTDLVERIVEGCQNCLFLQGAAGNINPIHNDTRDFADVRRYGMVLAGEVLKIIGSLQSPETPAMEPNLAAMTETLHLPVRDLPDPKPIEEAYEQATRSLEDAKTEEEKYKALQKTREYKESLDFIEHATEPVRGEAQVMRIGDLALAATPGEMFVQWGLEVKRRSAAPNTLVVELANGWVGYLLNQGGFAEGGYESLPGPWTKVSEEAGQMLVDKLVDITAALWR